MGKLVRAFFAAEIDEPLRAELAEVIEELKRVGARVSWVRPGNLHWTLKFLGDVPLEEIGRIAEAARAVTCAHEPFSGLVRGVGPFPGGRKLRMVAARMDDGGRMGRIRDELEPELGAFGVPSEGRAFKAHLTMGRVRGPRRLGELAAALERYAGREFGESRIQELVLFQSELSPQGPTYIPLAHIPLGG